MVSMGSECDVHYILIPFLRFKSRLWCVHHYRLVWVNTDGENAQTFIASITQG